jgi:site-specific DNA-methyltransferase (adenine-specific)
MINLIKGDCLEEMVNIEENSIDAIICDLPYGTTQNKWDSVVDLDLLWKEYNRIIKYNGAIVLFASHPFTSVLGCSNLKMLKYSLVYEKSHSTGHLNANRMPMRKHEDILVFYKKPPTYNSQKTVKENSNIRPNKKVATDTTCYGRFDPNAKRTDKINVAFPQSIIKANNSTTGGNRGLHPTQKPIELLEYLVKTYTNKGDLILDNTMGSGTTGVACLNLKRDFIGIEMDSTYFEIAKNRIEQAQNPNNFEKVEERGQINLWTNIKKQPMKDGQPLFLHFVSNNEVAVCDNPHCIDGVVDEIYGEKIYCSICESQTDC